jgi:hypothetical protein
MSKTSKRAGRADRNARRDAHTQLAAARGLDPQYSRAASDGDGGRIVTLNPEASELLRELMSEREAELGRPLRDDDLLVDPGVGFEQAARMIASFIFENPDASLVEKAYFLTWADLGDDGILPTAENRQLFDFAQIDQFEENWQYRVEHYAQVLGVPLPVGHVSVDSVSTERLATLVDQSLPA